MIKRLICYLFCIEIPREHYTASSTDAWVQLEKMGYVFTKEVTPDGLIVGHIYKDGERLSSTQAAMSWENVSASRRAVAQEELERLKAK